MIDDETSEGSHTLFALQVFVPVDDALWRFGLIRLVREGRAEPETSDKQRFWREVASYLERGLDAAHFGVWDYIDDDEAALDEYEQWCVGTVDDAQQDAEARQHDEPTDEPCYLFVTLLLLCDTDGPADVQLREAVDASEEDRWSRDTFRLLLAAVADLDWRGVKSDTLFVRPGDDGWGVTAAALQEEQYRYLRPLL